MNEEHQGGGNKNSCNKENNNPTSANDEVIGNDYLGQEGLGHDGLEWDSHWGACVCWLDYNDLGRDHLGTIALDGTAWKGKLGWDDIVPVDLGWYVWRAMTMTFERG